MVTTKIGGANHTTMTDTGMIGHIDHTVGMVMITMAITETPTILTTIKGQAEVIGQSMTLEVIDQSMTLEVIGQSTNIGILDQSTNQGRMCQNMIPDIIGQNMGIIIEITGLSMGMEVTDQNMSIKIQDTMTRITDITMTATTMTTVTMTTSTTTMSHTDMILRMTPGQHMSNLTTWLCPTNQQSMETKIKATTIPKCLTSPPT